MIVKRIACGISGFWILQLLICRTQNIKIQPAVARCFEGRRINTFVFCAPPPQLPKTASFPGLFFKDKCIIHTNLSNPKTRTPSGRIIASLQDHTIAIFVLQKYQRSFSSTFVRKHNRTKPIDSKTRTANGRDLGSLDNSATSPAFSNSNEDNRPGRLFVVANILNQ